VLVPKSVILLEEEKWKFKFDGEAEERGRAVPAIDQIFTMAKLRAIAILPSVRQV
jgi:hypothetical protein